MPGLSIDIIAAGPSPADPYDPAAPAWALAAGLSSRGHSVRVVHPSGDHARLPAPGVATASFPALPRHLGYVLGDAELARAARRQIRPEADVVLRDPLRPGPLGLLRRAAGPRLVALVREVELHAFEREGATGPSRSIRERIERWRDRGSLRKLEGEALREASAICCETPELAKLLEETYQVLPAGVLPLTRPVLPPEPFPTRTAARALVGVPLDDPVVAAIAASDDPKDPSLGRAREAIQRLRPVFAGARLVLGGAGVPGGNGITVRPGRDLENLAATIAAADVAVFLPTRSGVDPGVALAFRAGVPAVVSSAVKLPAGGEAGVRTLGSEEPGELSSALAELLADTAQRRALARASGALSTRFHPEVVAAELEATGALRPGASR